MGHWRVFLGLAAAIGVSIAVASTSSAERAPAPPAGVTRVPAPALPGKILNPGLSAPGGTPQPAVSPTPCAPRAAVAIQDQAMERQILKLVNIERASRKLAALVWSDALAQAARRHSADMADHNFFDHVSSDKSDYRARIDATCYAWSTIGENIGGSTTGEAARMVDSWMRSPPHRASILSKDFTEAGVGYAFNADSAYRHYWTINFGAPKATQPKPGSSSSLH